MVFIAYVQERGTQGGPCAGPLQAANPLPMVDTVQRLSRQSAPLLFMPHPCRSCDFHMVSLPSLTREKSEGPWNEKNLSQAYERSCKDT